MIHFYTNLKAGMNKDTALQEAQLTVLKKQPHPYYWAAFTLYGSWK